MKYYNFALISKQTGIVHRLKLAATDRDSARELYVKAAKAIEPNGYLGEGSEGYGTEEEF
jgi:hypothetical protein